MLENAFEDSHLKTETGASPGHPHEVRSRDEIFSSMKDHGLTIAQAIKASMQLFEVGLEDAKSIVTSHPSWKATVEAAGPYQDDLIRAFRAAEGAKT